MLLGVELLNALRVSSRTLTLRNQIRRVVTDQAPAAAGDSSGSSESIKFKMYTDTEERRGYKFDGSLDLTALIDRSSSMGFINTSDADGFKARNFRTGGEPPDPEKAKEIMVFFKNRSKPPIDGSTSNIKSVLQSSKATILGHAREVATSFLSQRMKPAQGTGTTIRGSPSDRAMVTSTDTIPQHQNDQVGNTQIKEKVQAPTNSFHFSRGSGRKAAKFGSDPASNSPQRGNYKMTKPPKKN